MTTSPSTSLKASEVSEIEARIAEVWASVLDRAVQDYDRNFLDVGGSSLKMMRVHAELMRLLDRQIPITTMFEFPSISALANHLAATPTSTPGAPAARLAGPTGAPTRPAALRRKFRAYKKQS